MSGPGLVDHFICIAGPAAGAADEKHGLVRRHFREARGQFLHRKKPGSGRMALGELVGAAHVNNYQILAQAVDEGLGGLSLERSRGGQVGAGRGDGAREQQSGEYK